MKRTLCLTVTALLLSGTCLGATLTGYISDEGCARNEEARNPECAKNCINAGATAVLVTSDGKIYTIADQEKVRDLAGEMVAVSGKIEGQEVKTVESAVRCSETPACEG